MARDCGERTRQDVKRDKKRDDELKQKLKDYQDAVREMRDALKDMGNIWRL